MDNADKINSSAADGDIHKEVELFLGNDIPGKNSSPAVTYNLEDEYAKTKKNRKPVVWILLGLCFFVVGAGTFSTVAAVINSNDRIAINIDTFDDLNLKSLLNSVGRIQQLYENAVRNKAALEQNYAEELSLIESKKTSDLYTLDSVASVSSPEYIAARRSEINSNYLTSAAELKKVYEERIKEADASIKKYQLQMDKYDSEEVGKAKTAESSIDSTKQLHDIEMKSQVDSYEKKISELRERLLEQQLKSAEEQKKAVEQVRRIYQAKIDLLDPDARRQNDVQDKIISEAGILNNSVQDSVWDILDGLEISPELYGFENTENEYGASIKNAETQFDDLKFVAGRFRPIPMERSIKDYVPAVIRKSYSIADGLSSALARASRQIDGFTEFAESQLSGSRYDGIVLDCSDLNAVSVYIKKETAAAFSEKEVQIEVLTDSKTSLNGVLRKSDYGYMAVLSEDTVKPGDRIRIVSK